MAESELPHDEQALLDGLVGGHGARVSGHDFRHRGRSRSAPHRHDSVHDVAFRQDAHQFAVAQHGQRADVVLHHETRSLEHGAGSFDRIKLAVFHEFTEGLHGSLLRHNETGVDSASPTASGCGGQYSITAGRQIDGCLNEVDCGFYDYVMVESEGLKVVRKELCRQYSNLSRS